MARRCDICGKGPLVGNTVSHANNKNKTRSLPNLRSVRVNVDGEGRHARVCSRCLKPVSMPVHIEFEEEYLPTVDVCTGAPVELREGEEEAYRISPNHMIDLADPAREYWDLALPMAPLCSADCPGLCPLCGAELSDVRHACTREQVDARWAKLAGLRESL